MFKIQINPDQNISMDGSGSTRVKQVNGVNGTPISFMPGFPDLQEQFKELGFNNIRMHDLFGVCDIDPLFEASRPNNSNQLIPNVPDEQKRRAKDFIADCSNARVIFPNAVLGMESGDKNLAMSNANYAPTDYFINKTFENMDASGSGRNSGEMVFRIGRSNDGGWEPPVNFDIYAELVGELVTRYSAYPWQYGLSRKVKYWEIWNEPDLNFFWNNADPNLYYEFYTKVARKIKSVDPQAKVGGAGAAFGLNIGGPFVDGFAKHCFENNVPLDFLSWHFYAGATADPQNIIDAADSIDAVLDAYGFHNSESFCTEWNSSPYATPQVFSKVQSAQNAAFVASTLINMNKCRVDRAHYYRGDGGSFGLFNDNQNPTAKNAKAYCTYTAQAFRLYNEMLSTPNIIATSDCGRTGISILAARSSDKINILVSNYRVSTSLTDMNAPPSGDIYYRQYFVDSGRNINQIDDLWSREHWFGNMDPSAVRNTNWVEQKPAVSNMPTSSPYPIRTRDYSQSAGGVALTLSNLGNRSGTLSAYRLYEGGDLSSTLPKYVSNELSVWYEGSNLNINDPNALESTVTLYTIELDNRRKRR